MLKSEGEALGHSLTGTDQPKNANRLGARLLVLTYVVLLAVSYVLSNWIFSGLDLRDLPGPGGVKIITRLATDSQKNWGEAEQLISATLFLFDGDIVQTTRAWMRMGGFLSVLGAILCGHALAGPRAALCAGALSACWSQTLYVQHLIGADAISLGLCWAGVGFAWWGAGLLRRPEKWAWLGLLLIPSGTLLASLAVAVKVVALPAAVLVGLTPFLVWRRENTWKQLSIRFVLAMALVGVVWFLSQQQLAATDSGHVQAKAPITLNTLEAGWSRLQQLPKTQPETAVLLSLIQLSWLGALLPGRSWLWRIGLGVAGAAALSYSAETISDKIHIRTLTTAALPIIVLSGCGLGLLTHWVQTGFRSLWRRLTAAGHQAIQPTAPIRRIGMLVPWLAPVLVAGMLLFDSLAFFHAWGGMRQREAGALAVDLPQAPGAWQVRYARMGRITLSDTAAYGSVSLTDIASTAPESGIAGVSLHDARDFHMRAGAVLADKPFVILESGRCCNENQSRSLCAQSVISALDRAGARLVLPLVSPGQDNRYAGADHQQWAQALYQAVQNKEGLIPKDSMWWVWDGQGSGGPLPCCGQGEMCYAPNQVRAPPPSAQGANRANPNRSPDAP